MKNVFKVFGIIVFAAIMGFSFASCATDSGGGDNDTPLVYSDVVDGKVVEITISRTDPSKAVLTPRAGDYYVIKYDGVVISKGIVTDLASGGQATFRPSADSPGPKNDFAGTFGEGSLSIPSIPREGEENLSVNATPDGDGGDGDNTPVFVSITAGTVPEDASWGSGDLYPLPVNIKSFSIMDSEVTYTLWYEVKTWADTHGYTFVNKGCEGHDGTAGAAPTSGNTEPVTGISWRDVIVWCNAYSEKENKTPVYKYNGGVLRESEGESVIWDEGKAENASVDAAATGFRLPTHAEWEYAARGGNPDAEAWNYEYAGSDTIDEVAWYSDNSGDSTHNVKTKNPNSKGLYDMSGNVVDFVYDRKRTERVDDAGNEVVSYYMARGGGFDSRAGGCSVSGWIYTDANWQTGFRLVLP